MMERSIRDRAIVLLLSLSVVFAYTYFAGIPPHQLLDLTNPGPQTLREAFIRLQAFSGCQPFPMVLKPDFQREMAIYLSEMSGGNPSDVEFGEALVCDGRIVISTGSVRLEAGGKLRAQDLITCLGADKWELGFFPFNLPRDSKGQYPPCTNVPPSQAKE